MWNFCIKHEYNLNISRYIPQMFEVNLLKHVSYTPATINDTLNKSIFLPRDGRLPFWWTVLSPSLLKMTLHASSTSQKGRWLTSREIACGTQFHFYIEWGDFQEKRKAGIMNGQLQLGLDRLLEGILRFQNGLYPSRFLVGCASLLYKKYFSSIFNLFYS